MLYINTYTLYNNIRKKTYKRIQTYKNYTYEKQIQNICYREVVFKKNTF